MKKGRALLVLVLVVACTISSVEAGCSTLGCSDCNFTLDGTTFLQSCKKCGTGYKTVKDGLVNICQLDLGLILGVALGAVAIIIAQIICFCVCGIYFKYKYKKPVQYTLNQIFEDIQAEKNDPEKIKEAQNKFKRFLQAMNDTPQQDCFICSDLGPAERLQFKEYQNWLKQKEKRAEQRRKLQHLPVQSNGVIQYEPEQEYHQKNPKGPTFFLEDCKHYYHLPCLKKQFKLQGHCKCQHNSLQIRVMVICKTCKLKQRRLTLRSKDIKQKGIDALTEYTCAVCNKKIYDQIQKLKWINKLVQ